MADDSDTEERSASSDDKENAAAEEHPRGEAHVEAQDRVTSVVQEASEDVEQVLGQAEAELATASDESEATEIVQEAVSDVEDIGREAEAEAEQIAQEVGEEFNLSEREIERVCDRVMERLQSEGVPTPVHDHEERSQAEDEHEAAEVEAGPIEAEEQVTVDDTPDEPPIVSHPYYRRFGLKGWK